MQLDYTLCTTSLARIFGKTPTEVNRLQMEYRYSGLFSIDSGLLKDKSYTTQYYNTQQ